MPSDDERKGKYKREAREFHGTEVSRGKNARAPRARLTQTLMEERPRGPGQPQEGAQLTLRRRCQETVFLHKPPTPEPAISTLHHSQAAIQQNRGRQLALKIQNQYHLTSNRMATTKKAKSW